ncbi:LysR family transcriptional regulator [Ensifer sp. HO-A22]|uniref:LysR family transcriptional regulator n=1 Tax=Ensifer oleiphilus TaxID=2742698 RepID=A0A7Y6UNL4_9HYPH|nr:LysR family transcriptional regulator [Ensifer oleiphilus]NVD40561.1 LysR family transcriptional regulator [Ensifer oleiphilus]
MDLRQLRQFAAVAEELHFGRAATRLNMTQPPLSQSIQALEKELNVQLFKRTKRSVELTSVGRQWLAHVRQVLDGANGLAGTARRLSRGEIGVLRLSFVSTADYSVLPSMVSRYRAAYPHVELTMREATSDLQIDALLDEEIDVGLIIAPSRASLHPTLSYRPLLREPLIAAVPTAWTEEGRMGFAGSALEPADFFKAPLILFPRRAAPAFHDIVSGYFAEHGMAFSTHQEAIQMQTIVGLVASGLGVALVPLTMTNLQRRGATYLPLAGRVPEVETGLAWRSADQNPALETFLAAAVAADSD